MSTKRNRSLALTRAVLLSSATFFINPAMGSDFVGVGPAPVQGQGGASYNTYSGAVTDIVVDPTNSKIMYVGTTDGGVWTTKDGGKTWTPLTDKQISLSIDSLVSDPTDATGKTLLAGTGLLSNGLSPVVNTSPNATRGGLQAGLLYSTDGGTTWKQLGAATLTGQSVDGVAARGNTILAGTYERQGGGYTGGLYRSSDGGATFTLISGTGGLPTGPVSALVADPTNNAKLYAAVTAPNAGSNNATAIYVSTNTGTTWTQVFGTANAGGAIGTADQTAIRMATGPGGAIAAGVVDVKTGLVSGLFYSGDGGATWKALPVPADLNTGKQAAANFTLAIDPNNTNFVYVAGDTTNLPGNVYVLTAYRIDVGANTATTMYLGNTADGSSVHPDSRSMAFDASGNLIVSTDGGIYTRTQPQTNTGVWQSLTGNLSAIETYQAAYGANAHLVAVAAQDNSVSLQSAKGSLIYNETFGGDGTIATVNDKTLAGNSVYYVSVQNLVGSSQRITVDGNGNIVANQNLTFDINPNPGKNPAFYVPFVLNKIDPSLIAIGGDNVYLTQDTMTGANAPGVADVLLSLTKLGGDGNGTAAIAYGTIDNTNALLASVGGSVWMSTSTAGGISVLPAYGGLTPVSLAFDTRTQQRFFVTDGTDLWSTTNQGAAFTSLTANLPTGFIRPNALEFVDNNGVDALLLGGLGSAANVQSTVVTADSSATGVLSNWRFLGTTLPNAPVNQLVYNPLVDVLTVSTFGRGVWLMYDFTSNYASATTLQFGLAGNDSTPDASLLTGNRPLVKYGAGTLLITGAGTYTGGTTINAGTMQLGNGGTGGSILGDVVDNGLLSINRSDTYTFGGAISGTGAFTQAGTGTTILTGNSTYAGLTTIAAGTLQVGNGTTTGSIAGNVVDNGSLIVSHSNNISVSNLISGTGGFTQAGSGVLTFTGTETYTGATQVTAGTLSVNGSIAASSGVTVGNGATLAGTGTVSTTTVANGGTIAPGNSVGTLNVNGNLTLAAGSTYDAEFTPATADKLQVGGTVTIAGQLLLAPTAGAYTNGTIYTLINSTGALTGVFSNVIFNGNFGGLVPTVSYDANDVFVTLKNLGQIAWSAAPGSSDWNTGTNWTSNTVPAATDTAMFNASTVTSININKTGTQVGGLQFNAGAPAYTFNIAGTAGGASSLVIGATGIVDQSSNAPSFVVSGVTGNTGTLEFDNGASAGDATITANAFGNVIFTGMTSAASAKMVTGAGGTVDISGLAGTSLSAGSIAGAGAFVLGAKTLNAGALNLNTEVSGVISGTGGVLNKGGTGTLTLTGANTYTGGTTISAGTLQLGNGGTSGSILGDVVDDGVFSINRSDTVTFGGAISGTGSFTQAGTGTTIFTGANTYTGGTTVAAGTLQVGDGGTNGSLTGNVTDNGQLIVNRSDNINVASVISGTGGFTQAGSGILTLASTDTYTGATQVSAGTLSVTGSIAASSGVTVTNGATLAGTGTVASTTIQSGGTLAPGNSVGMLNVAGNLNLAAGSIYAVDVTPGAADKIVATGTVTIAGQLLLSAGAGTYTLGTTYTLINSTGLLSGFFNNVSYTGSLSGYLPAISYDAHDAFLTLSKQIFWQANPGSTDWNTAANWTSGSVPGATDTAAFSATTKSGIDIQKTGTQIGGLEFVAGAPAYIFNVTGTAAGAASLAIGGVGIVDQSGNAPSFVVSGVSGNAGTLEFDNNASAGDAKIAANNFGTVKFTGASDAAQATLTAGAGGTIDISGVAGAGFNAGSIAGAGSVVLGAKTLTIGGLNTSTEVSGVISGTGGALVKTGTGTLTLSGANTYTGGTTISAGTLQLGNGAAGGAIAGDVVDNAQLAFDRSDAYTYAGLISGTGNVTQSGSGTTILTNIETYSGATSVTAGALQVDGTLMNSSLTVQSGGTLQGGGAIKIFAVANGGTVSPGGGTGSIGTLSAIGNASFGTASTLALDVAGNLSDMLNVGGSLNAAGKLAFNYLATPHFGDSTVFASAAVINGSFAPVADNIAGVLYPSISTVTANGRSELVLTIKAGSFIDQLTSPTADELVVAQALDAARAQHYGDLKGLYDQIDPLSDGALDSSLKSLVPDAARVLPAVSELQSDAFISQIWNHLGGFTGDQSTNMAFKVDRNGLMLAQQSAQAMLGSQSIAALTQLPGVANDTPAEVSPAQGLGPVFGNDVGGFLAGASLDGSAASGGERAHISGYLISGGLDMRLSPRFVVGAAIAYSDVSANLAVTPSSDKSTTFQGVAYGRYTTRDNWFADGFAGAGSQSITTDRIVTTGGARYDLHGKTNGSSPTIGAAFGYIDHERAFTLAPSAGFQWLGASVDAYTETGGPAALAYHSLSRDSLRGRVGLDADWRFDLWGAAITPTADAYLVHDFNSGSGNLTAAFAAAPSTLMLFPLAHRSATWIEYGLGAQAAVSDNVLFSVRYSSTAARNDLTDHSWTGQLSVKF